MDTEIDKKKRSIKIWIIDGLMVVTVVISVIVLTLLVLGYKVNQSGELEQTGLMQIHSIPTGAEVEIDGEKLNAKTNTNQALTEGTHKVSLTKDGYSNWEKEVKVEPGMLVRLDYPRLFKEDRVMEKVRRLDDLDFLAASPNREYLIYAKKDAGEWNRMSIKQDEVKVVKLDYGVVLDFTVGEVEIMEWNKQNTRVLVRVVEGGDEAGGGGVSKDDGREGVDEASGNGNDAGETGGSGGDDEDVNANNVHWLLMDLEKPEDSIDLTEKFGFAMRNVRMEDAGDKMLALREKELVELDLKSGETEVILQEVERFTNSGAKVGYLTTVEDGVRLVGVYKLGEKAGATVTNVTEDAEVQILVSEYRGQSYLTVMNGQEMTVWQGDFVGGDNAKKHLKVAYEGEVEMVAKGLSTNVDGGYIVAEEGRKRVVVDVEMNELYKYTADGDGVRWLDKYITYVVNDEGMLVAQEFDGGNVRSLMRADGKYAAVITVDNRWIYYVCDEELRRERL